MPEPGYASQPFPYGPLSPCKFSYPAHPFSHTSDGSAGQPSASPKRRAYSHKQTSPEDRPALPHLLASRRPTEDPAEWTRKKSFLLISSTSLPGFRGGVEDLRKGAKTARLILYLSFHPNEANAMSSSQPVGTGSPCTKKSAQNRLRITTPCVEVGRFSAHCGQNAAIGAFSVLLCAPEEAAVHRPARAKHARIRLRQGRTIPRTPTKGSLSAEDRAALFHSFCRDAFFTHVCSAVFPLQGFRGGRLTLFRHDWRANASATLRKGRLLHPNRGGSGVFSDPMTLSTLFFA